MPTKRHRITVNLPDHMSEVLAGMRELTGQPTSALIVDLLELSLPALDRMSAGMRELKAEHVRENVRIGASLSQAQRDLQPIAEEACKGLHDRVLGDQGEPVKPTLTRQRKVGAGAHNPPSSNTGGTTTTAYIPEAYEQQEFLGKRCTCRVTNRERMESRECPVHGALKVVR